MQLFIYRTAPFGQTRAGCRQNDFKCRHNAHMALSIDNRGYERGGWLRRGNPEALWNNDELEQ